MMAVADPTPDLTVVILTYNEARHIERAIRSVLPIACRIVVVDSYSSDHTVALARALGAEVFENRFVNQARQFQWALDTIALASDWVLRLDADEIVDTPLAAEIARRLPLLPADVTGVNLKRRHVFMGKWIRHGGRYPLWMLRLFRRGAGRIEDRWMDEHIVVTHGRTVAFDNPFTDDNLGDLGFFTDKHNRYATREAIEVLLARRGLSAHDTIDGRSASHQAAAKRWVKERIYNRIPFPLAALGYVLYRYVFQLGFLDRMPGAIYHVLQGFWYRFLVGAKTWELDRALGDAQGRDAIRARLQALTGHDIG